MSLYYHVNKKLAKSDILQNEDCTETLSAFQQAIFVIDLWPQRVDPKSWQSSFSLLRDHNNMNCFHFTNNLHVLCRAGVTQLSPLGQWMVFPMDVLPRPLLTYVTPLRFNVSHSNVPEIHFLFLLFSSIFKHYAYPTIPIVCKCIRHQRPRYCILQTYVTISHSS
jgi:hypothetical protein